MSFWPSPHPVVHIARRYGGVDPDTGNELLQSQQPVVRYAQEVTVVDSKDVLDSSGEFQNRIALTIKMSVENPEVYVSEDQVIVSPELDSAGGWLAGSGEAFWVDGVPTDDREGPWPEYFKGFGGVVMLRRVT